MIRGSDQSLGGTAKQARRELTDGWENLLTAAGEGAKRVSRKSRRGRGSARDRAALARVVLQGELPTLRRRWLAIGFGAGAVLGTVGGMMLARRRGDLVDEAAEQAQQTAASMRERAGTAAETVRERADVAADNAAKTAREAAAKVRENASKTEERTGRAESGTKREIK